MANNNKFGQIIILSTNLNFNLFQFKIKNIDQPFNIPKPAQEDIPIEPTYLDIPTQPNRNSQDYFVEKKFIYKIFRSKYNNALAMMEEKYNSDYNKWNDKKREIESGNIRLKNDYLKRKKDIINKNDRLIREWQQKKEIYEKQVEKDLKEIHKFEVDYNNGNVASIEKFNKELLLEILTNNEFEKQIETYYNPENKILVIEFQLPSTSDITSIKEVKYIASKDIFEEKKMNKTEYSKLYEDIIYKVTLFLIQELFNLDCKNCLQSIAFNGYVKTIDKSTGQNIQPFILSIFVSKEEFAKINLNQVDYKSCFKNLKGVCAQSLHTQTPIAPVIQINKDDKRFIHQKDVIAGLSEKTNLASMDWGDFEHLVREVFEKEFSVNGGEVRVTQASRDGGVDAIAFDPDPIRGGKIVIQAKRYTNTVGVNAVRDLYGTVMNEGAIKGILVTTSDYGSDAYNFASGKPITLLNGSNLLFLLEKHGHNFKIDIKEAKNTLGIKN